MGEQPTSKFSSIPAQPELRLEFPVVGVGASAGGVEAVTSLVRNLPTDSGMAFVVVLHLPSSHPSNLSSILARTTSLDVVEVSDGERIQPNRVFVIPAGCCLALCGNQFRLTPRDKEVPPTPHVIDQFFHSLAEQCGFQSAGVILSGTGVDGTAGLSSIKAVGGITFAQDSSAVHGGMPGSAVATGVVDFVLPPEQIAARLILWSHHHRDGARNPFAKNEPHPELVEKEEQADFQEILTLLTASSGIDFQNYKPATLRRRLERRAAICRVESLKAYRHYLNFNPDELEMLEQEALIHVTSFFREPEMFAFLKSTVLPQLITHHDEHKPFRVWVPGCSSGEEVYSILICLLEFWEERKLTTSIKLFATDVSERVISYARAGLYSEKICATVSPERLQKFFTKQGSNYQINKNVRELCVIAKQDITQDPPFSQLDLISCRNVLIYLGPVLQSRVFPIFHYALQPEGFLILGASETAGRFESYFSPFDKKTHIYRRVKSFNRMPSNFWLDQTRLKRGRSHQEHFEPIRQSSYLLQEADRVVLNRYAPPGVVIDDGDHILQFRGKTGRFLEPAPGMPSHNIMQMIRPEILPTLRSTIEMAKSNGLPARAEKLELNGLLINLEVIPITILPDNLSCFVVLFEDHAEQSRLEQSPLEIRSSGPLAGLPTQSVENVVTERLQQELAMTKSYLHSVIEAKDVANQELMAANEEVTSSYEELQSTNEELETAKEELQSSNEELVSINDQLERHVQDVIQLNQDLNNLIACVRIPVVIVDQDLAIRQFSPRAAENYSLQPSDIGRQIAELDLRIPNSELSSRILKVIDSQQAFVREMTEVHGRWISLEIRPFRMSEQKLNGVMILLIDIHNLKEREQQVIEARDFAVGIVELLHESLGVLVLDPRFRVLQANDSFYQTFHQTSQQTLNSDLFELDEGEWNIPELRSLLMSLQQSTGEPQRLSLEHQFRGAQFQGQRKRNLLVTAKRLPHSLSEERSDFLLLAVEDVTNQHQMAVSLKKTELLMQAIIDQARNAIISIDQSGTIHVFNHAAEKMFGYTAAEMMGAKIGTLMDDVNRAGHAAGLRHYLETGISSFIGQVRNVLARKRDGSMLPVELTVSEIQTDSGRMFMGMLADTSERQTLEREVLTIAAHEQLRIGQELHDEVAQELTGMTYLIKSLQEQKRVGLKDLARLELGLETTLSQVRNLARGLIPIDLDANGLQTALRAFMTETQKNTKITCRFFCEGEIVLADPRIAKELFLIAREAVNNCVKHAKPHEICLRLSLVRGVLMLEVSDDGVGIPVQQQSTGVGLHLMAYRTNMINGMFHIQNNPNGGTRIFCQIPIGGHHGPTDSNT